MNDFTPTWLRWYNAEDGEKIGCVSGEGAYEALPYGSTCYREFHAEGKPPHPKFGQFQWGHACSPTALTIFDDVDDAGAWPATPIGQLRGPLENVATSWRETPDGTRKYHVAERVPLELIKLWPKQLPVDYGHIKSNGVCYVEGVAKDGTAYQETGNGWLTATEETMRARLATNGNVLHTDRGTAADDDFEAMAAGWGRADANYPASIAADVLGNWVVNTRNNSLPARCGIIKAAGERGIAGMRTLFYALCDEYDSETGRGDADVYRAFASAYPAWNKATNPKDSRWFKFTPPVITSPAETFAQVSELTQSVATVEPGPQPLPWDEPVLLTQRRDLPAFPVGIYPPWLANMVDAVAEFCQVPADLPGMVGLSVLATALGGKARVTVRDGWSEPCNLFVTVTMPPGSRKSPVHAALTAPVLLEEGLLAELASGKIAEAKAAKALAAKQATAAMSAAVKGEGTAAAAIAATVAAESIVIPAVPRLVADDVTPEACATLMNEQGGRIAILSAEGGPFVSLAGRYSDKPNLELFLKGWSGDRVVVDRKSGPPERIDHPALTLGLCLQPEMLRTIAQMPGFNGRGLLARVLYSVPRSNVGRRKTRTAPVPGNVRAEYAMKAGELVRRYATRETPAAVTLSHGARELLLNAAEVLEPRLAEGGDLHHLAEWAAKLIGTTARIAALLHAAETCAQYAQYAKTQPYPDSAYSAYSAQASVSEQTMRSALALADYLTAHALAAHGLMGADPALADAEAVLSWLRRTGRAQFTRRDVYNAMRSRFPKADDVLTPLRVLVNHGWVRELDPWSSGRAGRPASPAYEVNPRTADENWTP